ncbi:unnamed protein product [Ectocarpus sp. 12 AP-2014]
MSESVGPFQQHRYQQTDKRPDEFAPKQLQQAKKAYHDIRIIDDDTRTPPCWTTARTCSPYRTVPLRDSSPKQNKLNCCATTREVSLPLPIHDIYDQSNYYCGLL